MKADHPLYQYSFQLVGNVEWLELIEGKNFKQAEFSLIIDLDPGFRMSAGKRIRIPLPQGFMERLTEHGWECDNLDYIETLAKQKGLIS